MDISKTNSENNEIEKTDKPPLEIVKVGKKNLAAVYITLTEEEKKKKKSPILSFTPREAFVLKTFLDVKSYEKTAEICEIDAASVKRYLRRPDLNRYLEELLGQAAIKSGTTVNWLLSRLRKTAEGDESPDDDQKWALKQIQDIIVKKNPGVVVNSNTQNNFYSGMDEGQLNAEILDAESAAS